MKWLLLFITITYLIACGHTTQNKSDLYDLSTARDAFDYPNLDNKVDTDIYIYQLKDTFSRRDSFLYVNYGSQYLKKFDEANLSLRPMAQETFRFSYCPFGRKPINITFDKNAIIVKLWTSGSLDPIYNEARLDSSELIKFKFLEHYFFRSKESFSKKKLKYYDSMLVRYPELKSNKYYKQLINKCTDYDSLKFRYKTQRIPISDIQFALLLDSLRRSQFDKLPWSMDYGSVSDGGGYTFEANTATRFKYFVCYGFPIDSLPMTRFCRYLLKVAGVEKETRL